jgi:hypothetical protein
MTKEKVFREIESLSKSKSHKSALEIFGILNEGQYTFLEKVANEDWFKHFFYQLEILVYNDIDKCKGDYFEIKFDKLVSNILYNLNKELV